MKVFIVSCALFAVAFGAPGIMDNHIVGSGEEGAMSYLSRIVGHCADSGDMTTCLTIKGITALNRAARSQNLEILPGVTFIRDPSVPVRAGKSLSENDIVAQLPSGTSDKTGRLLDLAMDSVSSFFGSHNLNVKFPEDTTQELARAIEEGRGKIKKFAGPLLLAVGAKLVALIPIFLGGLVLLATKALIVAKVAFILAAVLGFQKLGASSSGFNLLSKFSGAGGNGGQAWASPQQGWSSGSVAGTQPGWSSGAASSSYPYARSYENAQDMAYNAQMPAAAEQSQQH